MGDEQEFLRRQNPARIAEVLARTGITLGMHHGALAAHLEVSRRSVSRWAREGTWLSRERLLALATLAQHKNERSLAAEIAALGGETLASLGLEAPPATPLAQGAALPRRKVVDAVVCAAADAADVSPRVVRRALLAAVKCAREVGVTLEAMEEMLGGV